jgi:YihY family inner membrane protein
VQGLPARTGFVLRRAIGSLIAAAGTRDAAQVAFFVLMSFPALLLLVVWGLSTALDDPNIHQDVVDEILDAFPLEDVDGRREIEELLDGVAEGAGRLGWISAIALIYAASGAVGALRHAVAQAWGTDDPRPYAQGKALDIGLTFVVAPIALVALALSLGAVVPEALGDDPVLGGVMGVVATELLPLLLLFGVLTLIFRVLPTSPVSLRAAAGGAFVAVICLRLLRLATEGYFRAVGGSSLYGAISALLAASFAIYLAAIVVVYASHVAAQLSRLPNRADIERAMATGAVDRPLGRQLLGFLRGLVLRPRRRRDGRGA